MPKERYHALHSMGVAREHQVGLIGRAHHSDATLVEAVELPLLRIVLQQDHEALRLVIISIGSVEISIPRERPPLEALGTYYGNLGTVATQNDMVVDEQFPAHLALQVD